LVRDTCISVQWRKIAGVKRGNGCCPVKILLARVSILAFQRERETGRLTKDYWRKQDVQLKQTGNRRDWLSTGIGMEDVVNRVKREQDFWVRWKKCTSLGWSGSVPVLFMAPLDMNKRDQAQLSACC
jgi:hypothetical protein